MCRICTRTELWQWHRITLVNSIQSQAFLPGCPSMFSYRESSQIMGNKSHHCDMEWSLPTSWSSSSICYSNTKGMGHTGSNMTQKLSWLLLNARRNHKTLIKEKSLVVILYSHIRNTAKIPPLLLPPPPPPQSPFGQLAELLWYFTIGILIRTRHADHQLIGTQR